MLFILKKVNLVKWQEDKLERTQGFTGDSAFHEKSAESRMLSADWLIVGNFVERITCSVDGDRADRHRSHHRHADDDSSDPLGTA